MKSLAATVFTVAFLLDSTGSVLAGEDSGPRAGDPRAWLEQMSAAMSQMSYQGTFVYVQGEDVETMRITHVSDDDGVRERLVSVSGEPRELLRDSNGVRWVLGEDGSVFEDSAFSRSFFPELPLDQHQQTELSYDLKMGSTGRIAGHKAQNVKVLPRDEFRYGYSFWLEQHSGLLLKWELLDVNRKSLARLMFTDVRMGSEVDRRELKASTQLKKFKTVESALPSGRGGSKLPPRWKPRNLPSGFQLTAHRYFGKQDEGIYEHLVYSDGLAAVSVYVESVVGESGRQTGLSKLGTTHAYSRIKDGMLITVVGDVPAVTVKTIGNAVIPASP